MFTAEDYLYGWLIYFVSGLVFFACWWYLTAKVSLFGARLILRVVCLVTMFTPWYADPELDYLAPAVLMAAMEGIFDGASSFWRAGGPLVAALILALVLCAAYIIFRRIRSHGEPEAEAPAQ